MENNDLLEMVRSKAQGWLTKSYDAETRAQVQALLDNEDPTELIECFYKDLEFGTGGLLPANLNMLLFAKRIFTLFLRLRLIKKRLPISWRMTDTKTIYVNCDKNYTQTVFILPIPSWITSPRIQKLLLHREDLCFGWN